MPVTDIKLPVKFEIRAQPAFDGIIAYCHGEITAGQTSIAFHSAIVDLVRRYPKVTVDLSGIGTMDRIGLATLVGLYATARTAKATLSFMNLLIKVTDTCPSGHRGNTYKWAS